MLVLNKILNKKWSYRSFIYSAFSNNASTALTRTWDSRPLKKENLNTWIKLNAEDLVKETTNDDGTVKEESQKLWYWWNPSSCWSQFKRINMQTMEEDDTGIITIINNTKNCCISST